MATQRSRFKPMPPRAPLREREISLPLVGGLHAGVAPQDLPRGFSPDLRNLTPDVPGWVAPRSGLSRHGAFNFNGAVLGAFETFDDTGVLGALATSARSVSFLHATNQAWSALSYVPGNLSWHTGNLSGTSSDYFTAETVYDDSLGRMLVVFSNNTDSFKYISVASTTTTFSDFTWADSIASTTAARDIASVNDRLVLFNTLSSTGTRFPTRVMASARGNPRSFLVADGAYVEDLMDMKGSGQAAVRWKEFLVLFTELEIWRAIPTEDDYAFRFARTIDNMGTPWPRTIATAPEGVIFVGRDREVYITDGVSIQALGPVGGEGASRIQRKLLDEALSMGRAWALYNATDRRYELYYTAADSPDGYPSRALFYSLPQQTWWPQRFAFGLSDGVDLVDPATLVTWDDIKDSWDAMAAIWEDFNVTQGNRRPNVFSSTGAAYRYFSAQTSDGGEAIDVRWRSPGFKAGTRKVHLKEIWLDYENDSASSASLWLGSSRSGSAFVPATAPLSLAETSDPLFVPVWKTDHHPSFELRIADGGRPRIASFSATIQDASKF
jgi:hypothetical protein